VGAAAATAAKRHLTVAVAPAVEQCWRLYGITTPLLLLWQQLKCCFLFTCTCIETLLMFCCLQCASPGDAVQLCQPRLEPLHRPLHAARMALHNAPWLRHQHCLLMAHLRLPVRPSWQHPWHRLVQAGAAPRHAATTRLYQRIANYC
jgi:hypothetical protein